MNVLLVVDKRGETKVAFHSTMLLILLLDFFVCLFVEDKTLLFSSSSW